MTKLKASLLKFGLRFGPSVLGSLWLFVCLFFSEFELAGHCALARIAEGTLVGIVAWYASGYLVTRVWMAREDSYFSRMTRQFKGERRPWKS